LRRVGLSLKQRFQLFTPNVPTKPGISTGP
jgi:hypothetical protein